MKLNVPAWRVDGDEYSLVTAGATKMAAGVYYHWESSARGIVASPSKAKSDELFDLPGLPTRFILDQIALFWKKTEEYRRYGFLQKRGIILYGPPGCGKTAITSLLKKQIVTGDGVVFLPTHGFNTLTSGIEIFRQVEPDRPIMTLVEDIESRFETSNGSNTSEQETAALALYDGERQFNNIIHVATTNKPELLEDRLIRRPGRFDLVIGIHAPAAETRRAYLQAICNGSMSAEQLDMIVEKTEGLSLAYLREIASTYLVLEIPLEETIARLRNLSTKKYSSKTTQTGFTIGYTNEKDEPLHPRDPK